jgi:peptidoglycan/xylan/chitin deacetylase (PgdA/CDA1 family)
MTAFSESSEKCVYITFDDGPTKNTPAILDTLNKFDAKATFFLLEDRIRQFPDYVVRINAEGHAIGLHGVSHDYKVIYSTPSMPLSEMNKTNDALYSVIGYRSHLVRTPYGSYPYMTDEQYKILRAAHMRLWDWTIDPRDSIGSNVSEGTLIKNIKRDLKTADEDIVILHDRKSTADSLYDILFFFKSEGYTFAALDESMTPVNFKELYGK